MRFMIVGVIALFPSLAAANCFSPEQPYCLTAYGTFEDDYSFSRCRSDMDSFREDVGEYSRCLLQELDDFADEQTEKRDASVAEYEAAVEYFNCMASGNSYCSRP